MRHRPQLMWWLFRLRPRLHLNQRLQVLAVPGHTRSHIAFHGGGLLFCGDTLFAGGSFGRRSNFQSDYVTECVRIAKKVGKGRPVKLVWTREDDMRAGYYRPMTLHKAEIGYDADGNILAWDHRIVSQSIVGGTPFDFRTPHAVGERVRDSKDEQIVFGRGYDHNWVITASKPSELTEAAELRDHLVHQRGPLRLLRHVQRFKARSGNRWMR